MTNAKRKGISPIIATVLLIAITIAAGLAIYGWVSGLIGAGTSSKLVGSTPITLSVASVTNKATTSGNTVTVTGLISNLGHHSESVSSTTIEIVSANGYVYTGSSLTSPSTPVTIAAGSTQSVPVIFKLQSGDKSITFTLSIVGATDSANEPVIANSVSFTLSS